MAKTEYNAIRSFGNLVADGKIDPSYLNANDKYPIWDGELIIYKNEDMIKNEDIDFRIPIQIKGISTKNAKSLDKKHIFRKFPKKNISMFNQEDGVLLVDVVYFDKDNYSIYYCELLPIKLKRILEQQSNEEKIRVKYKMVSSREEIERVCQFFNENRKLQPSDFLGMFEKEKPIKGDKIHIDARLFDSKKENYEDIYIYHVDNGKKLPSVKAVLSATSTQEFNVTIEGKVFFNEFSTMKTTKGPGVRIGDIFQVTNDLFESQIVIGFLNRRDITIDYYLKNIEFMIALIKYEYFCLGEVRNEFLLFKGEEFKPLESEVKRMYLLFSDLVSNLKNSGDFDKNDSVKVCLEKRGIKQ